ncbi:hypothetical protein BKA62DRAFT_416146 [Auriculariales sp. MPI-PUGE-AT-0066]|nr:hypothetical protein BKA62DRAFT_416146 [Auriculariales sp. MPI-PUGE-AT-0066]
MEFSFKTPVHTSTKDNTDLSPPPLRRVVSQGQTKSTLDLDPTLNNVLYVSTSAPRNPYRRHAATADGLVYSWWTALNSDKHPTTTFFRDSQPVAQVVWMGGQFKELARNVTGTKRLMRAAPRSASDAFDIVTASRSSTLKLVNQPTVLLDDFLMKCGLFTNRRSRRFITQAQMFTWLDDNENDLVLIAGETSSSERIAVVNQQTNTLRVGPLAARMLPLDTLVVTAVVMLHKRCQRTRS